MEELVETDVQKDPAADMEARVAALEKEKADLAAKAAEAAEAARRSASALDRVEGQISVIAAAAAGSNQPATGDAEAPTDILNDTERVLQHQFEKRIKPLRDASLDNAVATQRELIAIKRKEEWAEYGPAVEAAIVNGRVTKEQLAAPGTLENILDFVKSKNVEKIVEKRVQAEVAKYQADAAKAAGGGNSSQLKPGDVPSPKVELTDEERFVAAKFGISEKDYMETASKTTFDGVRYRGGVN